MNINELLLQKNITKYKLSKISGVSFTTISEITTNKSKIINCAAGTLYRLAKALNVSMEVMFSIKEYGRVCTTPITKQYSRPKTG